MYRITAVLVALGSHIFTVTTSWQLCSAYSISVAVVAINGLVHLTTNGVFDLGIRIRIHSEDAPIV